MPGVHDHFLSKGLLILRLRFVRLGLPTHSLCFSVLILGISSSHRQLHAQPHPYASQPCPMQVIGLVSEVVPPTCGKGLVSLPLKTGVRCPESGHYHKQSIAWVGPNCTHMCKKAWSSVRSSEKFCGSFISCNHTCSWVHPRN